MLVRTVRRTKCLYDMSSVLVNVDTVSSKSELAVLKSRIEME
jgi:hypothetical protein